MDFGQDGISGRGPPKGGGVMVVVVDEAFDVADELGDAGKGPAPDGPLGDESEPAFDLIEP